MRARILIIILLLVTPIFFAAHANAQPTNIQYIVLYAHTSDNTPILNEYRTWTGQKAVDISRDLVFKLSPALGSDLQIYGGITMTVYLRGTVTIFGTVVLSVSELKSDGTEIPVPGARIDSPIVLNSQTNPVTLGVGVIEYQFSQGSSILLHIRVDQQASSGIPLIVWDDPSTPTNIRLPAVSPTNATFEFSTQNGFSRILEADPNTNQAHANVGINVIDAFGIYRFMDSSVKFTATNGSVTTAQLQTTNSSRYAAQYLTTATLDSGQWQVELDLRDMSGSIESFKDAVWVCRFYTVRVNVSDSTNIPIQNASLIVSFRDQGNWSGFTNSTGWSVLSLPSSIAVGPLNLTVDWLRTETSSSLNVVGESTFFLRIPVYNPGLRVMLNGIPMPFADVKLIENDSTIAEVFTGVDGNANFRRVPAGNYTIQVDYLLLNQFEEPVNINADRTLVVSVPIPHRTSLLLAFLAVLGSSVYIVVERRRTKLYPQDFSYFFRLMHGDLPNTCFAVIVGNSGSGKSVLLNTLVAEQLTRGRCIYITNLEYPDTIRKNMTRLGIFEGRETDYEKIMFVDAYSAIGGTTSKEERSVSSHTDLTALGMEISKCLESTGPGTDVYLDSLTPIANVLRMDYLVNFLQAIAAKVKANDGKLCVTIGSGIEKGDLTKLEESSDLVIELQLQESGKGQRKRLRIKKLRDHPYDDKWVRFQVEGGRGIVFLTRTRP